MSGKKLLYVMNKADIAPYKKREYSPCVYVSAKDRLGGTKLFKKIMELSRGETAKVGVLGYPNVGKSSVINMLKGKKAASVSSTSGHTRGVQFVRAKTKLLLFDTPGVIPFMEKDLYKQVIICAVNPQQLKEPEYYAMLLYDDYKEILERHYKTKAGFADEFLEQAALAQNILKKGGEPDTRRLAVQIILKWQRGEIDLR